MPLVSVIIATYGRPTVVTRAVEAALAQTITDLEVLVVVERDDSQTVAALAAIADPRLRYVVNPLKNGPGPARDFGVQQSVGMWVAFLDDDDEWHPTKLAKQLAALSDARTAICMTLSNVVYETRTALRPTRPYDESEPIDEWLFGRRTWFKTGEAMLQTSSLVAPRTLWSEIRFRHSRHEEWELAIRAVKELGYRLITVREPLVTHYSGNLYSWRASIDWIESMRGVVSAKAYSGFCLTIATQQGLLPPERSRGMMILLRQAFRYGRPTAKQLFAFVMIWLLPTRFRHWLRAVLRGRVTAKPIL